MLKEKMVQSLDAVGAKGAFIVQALGIERESAEYQADLVVPSASLIKVFVLIEAMRRIKAGVINLDTIILVKEKDIVDFSVLKFLKPREYMLEELLKLMVTYSDNTATNVLIDTFTMENINADIKNLGYKESILQRKMMDFKAAKEGKQNFTNVREMSDVLKRLYNNQLLGSPYDEQMLSIMKGQTDECMMRRKLPDEITIARKSGELDCMNHEMAIVYTDKMDYLYVFFVWETANNNIAREVLAQTSKIAFDFYTM